MAINQNHLFEDLNGVKCAIVEKNVAAGRVDFLRRILEYNRYTVVVVASPPPKPAAAAPAAATPASAPASPAAAIPAASAASAVPVASVPAPATSAAPEASVAAAPAEGPGPVGAPAPPAAPPPPPAPETFTVGVTDVMFNPVNAIFGRLLKTPEGHIVTLAYWQQKENQSDDEKPYFDKR
jgi:hypothetical protein